MRDPSGAIVREGDRVFRLVNADGKDNAVTYLTSTAVERWCRAGSCVRTLELERAAWPAVAASAGATLVLEHEAVWFPSYPYEWTPGMLRAAGSLTLALARDLAGEGAGLKDATPFNVLFRGSRPVFIDALSVEKRDPTDPLWFAYGQFVRTFVLPLLAVRSLRWTMRHSFTGARDGLDPASLYSLLSWPQRLRAPARGTVTAPVLLSRSGLPTSIPSLEKRRVEPARATFVLRRILGQLEASLDAAAPVRGKSDWTGYSDPRIHPAEYHEARRACVAETLAEHRPKRVLDVGTNDGSFALIAAESGADVIAIDRDEAVVEMAYRRVADANANVLPLVIDLSDPTPATGWRNRERLSFLQRASGRFDAVLCMAVLHHLAIGDGVALGETLSLLASLTTDLLLAEFVPMTDPWCEKLARGRPISDERWSETTFEAQAQKWFRVERRVTDGLRGRTLFILRRNPDARNDG